VFADDLGRGRHLVVSPAGIAYVNTWSGRYYGNRPPMMSGSLVALQEPRQRPCGSDPSLRDLKRIVRQDVPQPKKFSTPMPPMGGAQLSDEQVSAVAAYVWAISHR
jgi:hypothetical protein